MKLLPVIATLLFLVVLILGMGWQFGYFKSLGQKLTIRKWRVNLSATVEKPQLTNKAFERRSLIQQSRPYLAFGLLLGFLWVLAAIGLFVLSSLFHAPIIVIVGMIVAFLALIIANTRFRSRYLTKLVLSTHCPQCGNFPMDFVGRSEDERILLICKQCHTEWDIGSADI